MWQWARSTVWEENLQGRPEGQPSPRPPSCRHAGTACWHPSVAVECIQPPQLACPGPRPGGQAPDGSVDNGLERQGGQMGGRGVTVRAEKGSWCSSGRCWRQAEGRPECYGCSSKHSERPRGRRLPGVAIRPLGAERCDRMVGGILGPERQPAPDAAPIRQCSRSAQHASPHLRTITSAVDRDCWMRVFRWTACVCRPGRQAGEETGVEGPGESNGCWVLPSWTSLSVAGRFCTWGRRRQRWWQSGGGARGQPAAPVPRCGALY